MDEKNLNNENASEKLDEVTEAVEEKVEEVAEEAAEAVEEIVEEAAETAMDEVADAANTIEEMVEGFGGDEENIPAPKKNMGKLIGIIAAAVVVIAIVVLCIVFGPQWFNKYNRMGYIDVSGQTVQDIADSAGMTLEEFLTEYDLPSDMPKNTSETAAFYTIPVSRMAEMYGMDFATMKDVLEWGDEVTETSTWGEAEGATKVGVYVGEENLEDFKSYYGLGDEVTAETLWSEIRNTIDQQRRDERIAMEAEMAQAEQEALKEQEDAAEEEKADDKADDTEAEAPAEGEEAPAENAAN